VNRDQMLQRLRDARARWDVLVIGGGATGLGCAVDAASRGYRTLLLEQSDFAKATSSRSTKLIHGGVRYLRQGNLSLVVEALRERGILYSNAPHLVRDLAFVVPTYDWWQGPFYGVALRLYDVLAGRHGFGRSRMLSREETLERIPNLEPERLRGGVLYFDGQFDDARLAISLAQTAADHGAVLANYTRVAALLKAGGVLDGAVAVDEESGEEYRVRAAALINATGVFADGIRRLDDPEARPMVTASQGVHLVLDRSFLHGHSAIMVPQTDDGRVLFAIPWHDRMVVGTTDTPMKEPSLEPRPLKEEVSFLLAHVGRYLHKDPGRGDIMSAYAGLRPLVAGREALSTASISREHHVEISASGLVTIAGGKWTTYRRMAQDAVDRAAFVAQLPERPSTTQDLRIHGYREGDAEPGALAVYGSDGAAVEALCAESAEYGERLHPTLPYRGGEVIWAVRHEMARRVEDVLARRTRALLLDAGASAEAAPKVARLMAKELRRDEVWMRGQESAFRELAEGYRGRWS
jgi:glycerol-3-phosphate dehydrogenase